MELFLIVSPMNSPRNSRASEGEGAAPRSLEAKGAAPKTTEVVGEAPTAT